MTNEEVQIEVVDGFVNSEFCSQYGNFFLLFLQLVYFNTLRLYITVV